MTFNVLQSVAPSLKLVLPASQRSPVAREKIASKLSKQFQKMIGEIPKGELTIDKYKEMIYSLTPGVNPPIKIDPVLQKGVLGSCQTTKTANADEDGIFHLLHDGYKIGLDLNGEKIVSDKTVVVHETRHLFDKICSPKFISHRMLEYSDNDKLVKSIEKTVHYVVNPNNFFSKEMLKNKFQGFNNDVKMGLFAYLRNILKTEMNAYKDECKFAMNQQSTFIKKCYVWSNYKLLRQSMKVKHSMITEMFKEALRSRHSS